MPSNRKTSYALCSVAWPLSRPFGSNAAEGAARIVLLQESFDLRSKDRWALVETKDFMVDIYAAVNFLREQCRRENAAEVQRHDDIVSWHRPQRVARDVEVAAKHGPDGRTIDHEHRFIAEP